jgi:small ligand-binding sensory domain FIST
MRWCSAVSDLAVLDDALHAVAGEVAAGMRGEAIDLAVLFVSQHFAAHYEALPERLRAVLPHRVLLGCAAGGVIGGGREVEHRPGIALTVAHLPDVVLTPFALAAEQLPDQDAAPSAWHLAHGVPPEPLPQFVLLADPFSFPVDAWIAGLDYAYPRSTKIGGLASAARAPGDNVLYAGARTLRAGAVGLALSGEVRIDTAVAQGCRPIGQPLQITRCDDHVLLELGGEPPLRVLQELLPQLTEADRQLVSQALFLGVVTDELATEHRAGDFLIRNLIGIDPQSGAIAIGEHLREGQTVQFHVRDARTSAEDLDLVLQRFAASTRGDRASGALLFSCLGRGMYLYGRADHDTDVFRQHLGDVPLGGFFCNGEIGPVGGSTHVHGYTSSFGIFRPAKSR